MKMCCATFQQVFRQTRHQHLVHCCLQFCQAFLFHQQRLDRISNCIHTEGCFQQPTDSFYRGLLYRGRDQYIPNVIRFIGAAAHVQLEIPLQDCTRHFVHVIGCQSVRWCRLVVGHLDSPFGFGQLKVIQMPSFFKPPLSIAVY